MASLNDYAKKGLKSGDLLAFEMGGHKNVCNFTIFVVKIDSAGVLYAELIGAKSRTGSSSSFFWRSHNAMPPKKCYTINEIGRAAHKEYHAWYDSLSEQDKPRRSDGTTCPRMASVGGWKNVIKYTVLLSDACRQNSEKPKGERYLDGLVEAPAPAPAPALAPPSTLGEIKNAFRIIEEQMSKIKQLIATLEQ